MVDRDVVAKKLSELKLRADRVAQHRQATAADLAARPDQLDLVSFNLFLAVQVCADVAAHIVVDEGWGAPGNVREGFEMLEVHGVISRETLAGLKAAVGLRNIVAHAYGRLDPDKVHLASHQGLPDLQRFAREVAGWLGSRG